MNLQEKTLSSKELYSGRIVRLQLDEVELPNGNMATREVVRHNGGVAVLPLDKAGNVLMVRQYRYPYAEVLLELPAGKLERDEDPAACGRRELEEETGHVAGVFEPLGRVYPSPGFLDEMLHLYYAKALTATQQHLDDDEFLAVERVPFEQALEWCMDGTIRDGKTLVALLKYNELRRRG